MKKNKSDDNQKLILGIVVGGLLGGTLYYLLHKGREENEPILDKVGKAIANIGALIEDVRVDNRDEAVKQIEKTIPQEDTLNNALTWIATGINLWQKIKRG